MWVEKNKQITIINMWHPKCIQFPCQRLVCSLCVTGNFTCGPVDTRCLFEIKVLLRETREKLLIKFLLPVFWFFLVFPLNSLCRRFRQHEAGIAQLFAAVGVNHNHFTRPRGAARRACGSSCVWCAHSSWFGENRRTDG